MSDSIALTTSTFYAVATGVGLLIISLLIAVAILCAKLHNSNSKAKTHPDLETANKGNNSSSHPPPPPFSFSDKSATGPSPERSSSLLPAAPKTLPTFDRNLYKLPPSDSTDVVTVPPSQPMKRIATIHDRRPSIAPSYFSFQSSEGSDHVLQRPMASFMSRDRRPSFASDASGGQPSNRLPRPSFVSSHAVQQYHMSRASSSAGDASVVLLDEASATLQRLKQLQKEQHRQYIRSLRPMPRSESTLPEYPAPFEYVLDEDKEAVSMGASSMVNEFDLSDYQMTSHRSLYSSNRDAGL
ncbi:hypothetical protein HDU98_005596 [Podochytrium sp. JEL0797]|nr:hypothetical protein HDU98_005596 [Podochytrium sp. JEL0797]